MINIEELAGVLYEDYCRAVGGKAFNGDPLPSWKEFYADEKKQAQAQGWIAVANKAFDELQPPTAG